MSEYLQGWNCWQTLIDITRHCQIILDITIYHLCLTLLDNARYSYYQMMQNIFQILLDIARYLYLLLDQILLNISRYCQIFMLLDNAIYYQILLDISIYYQTRYCQILLDIARYLCPSLWTAITRHYDAAAGGKEEDMEGMEGVQHLQHLQQQ